MLKKLLITSFFVISFNANAAQFSDNEKVIVKKINELNNDVLILDKKIEDLKKDTAKVNNFVLKRITRTGSETVIASGINQDNCLKTLLTLKGADREESNEYKCY